MMQILAILPLALIFFLILVFKWPPLKAMLTALSFLLLMVIFIWQMHFNWVFAASLKGFLFTLEIGLIIIGAVFFLSILRLNGFQSKIKNLIQDTIQDRRAQVIIITWAFTALIEGSAGFGTPAILASAILITLGFPAIAAITLSLIGAAIHTSFGAVGTPIIFGFGAGLKSDFLAYLPEITSSIAFFNIFIGFFICLIILAMLIFVFGKKEAEVRKVKYILEMIPFLIVSTLLVTVPAWLLAYYLGPELPSLVGGLIGLFLLLVIAQKSWFLPKTNWDFNKVTEIKADKKLKLIKLVKQDIKNKQSLFSSFSNIFKILLPYFFLALVIFVIRAPFLPIGAWLTSPYRSFSLTQIFGTEISYSFSPFYALGILLFLSGIILTLFFHQSSKKIKIALNESFQKTKKALLVLVVILVFVQIFIHSGQNLNNYQSMPLMLATSAADISGPFFPIFIPLIGALGSFITGSTTVSNLLFANFQANSALILGTDPKLFLSLQSIGAALGNMTALHNVIVVLAIVGQISKVGLIIKYNALIVILLCLFLGLTALLIN